MSDIAKIQLKTACILNVPLQIYSNDFTFIVNSKEFKTSRLISDLLSPKICKIHKNDPLLARYTINTKLQGDFSLILQLVQFDIVDVSINDIDFIYEVLNILENESIKLINPTDTYTLSLDNVISYLKRHELFECIYFKEIESDIDFIASHFYEFSETQKEELLQLKETTISRIFQNDKLRLKDEDEFLNFINKLYKIDKKYENLYEKVIFSNVSSSSMIEFVKIIDFNDMSNGTWSSLSNRLIEEMEVKNENKSRYSKTKQSSQKLNEKIKTFVHNENQEFDGIINYLTNKTGGNIHDNGTVEVTNNSINSIGTHPKNLFDLNKDNYYHSKSRNLDIWFCFDFKNFEIEISSYSLKSSSGYGANQGNFRNWVVEVSNDCQNWTKIDEHSNYSELNEKNIIRNFKVNPNNFSRYCRIRHTGEYWGYNQNYCLKLGCVEFYGRIKEE